MPRADPRALPCDCGVAPGGAVRLSAQVRRTSCSAAANIAEGAAVRGNRQFRKYLDTALGSLSELSYYLLLARDVGYLPKERWGEFEALRDHARRLTWRLYASMTKT